MKHFGKCSCQNRAMKNYHQNIQLRQMRADDLDWVVTLGANTAEFRTDTDAAQFYSVASLKRWIKDSNGVTLTVEIDGQKAGFLLGYYMAGPNDGYINCTVVEPKYKNQGLGALLQKSALAEFEKKGTRNHPCDYVFSVVSEKNEPMLHLKKKLGFEVGSKFHYVEIILPYKNKGL